MNQIVYSSHWKKNATRAERGNLSSLAWSSCSWPYKLCLESSRLKWRTLHVEICASKPNFGLNLSPFSRSLFEKVLWNKSILRRTVRVALSWTRPVLSLVATTDALVITSHEHPNDSKIPSSTKSQITRHLLCTALFLHWKGEPSIWRRERFQFNGILYLLIFFVTGLYHWALVGVVNF